MIHRQILLADAWWQDIIIADVLVFVFCPRRFVLGLGLCLEYLSLTCPCTFYLGLVKLFVMLVLVIFLSLQWLVHITYLLIMLMVVYF